LWWNEKVSDKRYPQGKRILAGLQGEKTIWIRFQDHIMMGY
jgi:hypothetical protein